MSGADQKSDFFYSVYENCLDAANYLKEKISERPEILIISGTGLSTIEDHIQVSSTISFADIPNFPIGKVSSHKNKFVFGKFAGKDVVAMVGRIHFYESAGCNKPVFPIRVMSIFGIKTVIMTNAVGGINTSYQIGDLAVIKDHVYFPGLAGNNPLVGFNDERFGPRFPALKDAYCPKLRELFFDSAKEVGQDMNRIHTSVFAGVAGPSFETPSEIRFLRLIGCDTVGMSTCPEILTCAHLGLQAFAVSLVTNVADDEENVNFTKEETKIIHFNIDEVGKASTGKFMAILEKMLSKM